MPDPFQKFLSKFYDSDSGIAFSEFGKPVGFYMFLAPQVFMDAFAQRAGSFPVHHAYRVQVGEEGVVQLFVQL